jgi:MYXO-CTERM domain-containing protein
MKRRALTLFAALLGVGLGSLTAPAPADAFCGFYVAGADQDLYNSATLVVLMRDGTRTVLSMQNDYQGPPEDFALVIPVPVVLQEGDVKTLPKEVFDRVDKLAAPRLVEYWEEDPCDDRKYRRELDDLATAAPPTTTKPGDATELGVKIEAQFEVAEYQIVVLSAEDSTGLDTWLKQEKYNIPAGAQPLLEPYVQAGMKFFVAKVDAKKVEFENGRATLSPLRFHYDSPEFALPVRLGLINAQGPQDLLIHILAKNQRYQVENYPNATIPTNLEVKDETREQFGKFYVSLFDHTLAQHPKAVVTEYAWAAGSCDPCPEPALTLDELVTLGADVLPSYTDTIGKATREQTPLAPELQWTVPNEFVLTRLHARYDASSLGEDLVFSAAPGLVGGREWMQANGKIEQGAREDTFNSFQARYVIRHPWTGKIECETPRRGQWGGPPDGGANQPKVARELAFVARDASLGSFVTTESSATIGLATSEPPKPTPDAPDVPKPDASAPTKPDAKTAADAPKSGCACSAETTPTPLGGASMIGVLGMFGMIRRRRTQP